MKKYILTTEFWSSKLNYNSKIQLVLLFTILCVFQFYAQSNSSQQVVTGNITDAFGSPLIGANIVEKGTRNGVTADFDGNFSISLSTDNPILVFSFIGFANKEVTVDRKTYFDIVLEESAADLDEVVVIGYGSVTKKEITGSVASIKNEDFNKGAITDPIELLQGKVAGLSIVNARGGDPNQTGEFLLRGVSTLSGGASPLVIVDGVPGVDLNSISPTSIESIDVLKDGSAAAIYGTRGTNGVIIITTKRAKPGDALFEFATYISTQTVANKLENLTADQFRNALSIKFPGNEASYDYGSDTDWFEEITRTPTNYKTELSLTGGGEKFSYRASLDYIDNKGLVQKNSLDRLNTSLMINQKGVDDKLSVTYKIAYTTLKREKSDTYALQQAFRYNPTEPVYDDTNPITGGYYMNNTPFQYFNPVAMIKEREAIGKETYFTGSLDASFEILERLKIGALGSLIKNNEENSSYNTRYYPIALGTNGEAYKQSVLTDQKLLELRAEYAKDFEKHSLQGFIGYSYQEQGLESFSALNKGFDLDGQTYNNLGAGSALLEGAAEMSSYKESNKLIAFYGRLMYNYDDKYFLSSSLRKEGSSRFGKNEKWGLFPAISAGWILTNENFTTNLNWLDYLKIRAGYGVTGNQDIPNYLSLQLLQSDPRYKTYYNGAWINTYAPTSNENPDLKWEEKGELDIGFDFTMLDSKLYGTFDYYLRNTNDLLWYYNVPVPPNLYDQTYDNVGKIRNQGIELTLNYDAVKTDDLTWTTGLNYSRNRNKLVSFSDAGRGYELTHIDQGYIDVDIKTYTIKIEEGKPLGNFVGPVFLGIAEDGSSIFKDVDGDGNINQEVDRELIGNAYPKFQLGWNNSFKYKNLDLNFFFRGVFGHDILNYHRMYYDNFAYFGSKNILASALDHPEYTGAAEYSSRYVEDGSYIKLDNITLGYNLKPNKILKSLRVYMSGQQLITITNYKGADPEISLNGLAPGIDNYSYYPRVKTYTIGLNATF